MLFRETSQVMKNWLAQATPSEQQLDRRWIGWYRELASQDSFWWLSWAGPFTEAEQYQWNCLFKTPVDDETKKQLGPLLKQSREREIAMAQAERRNPRLHYPAIEIDEVRRRVADFMQLDSEIEREEPNAVVRLLYHETIEKDMDYLRMIEATYEGDAERFWLLNQHMYHEPTSDEMAYAFTWVRRLLQQGFERPETTEASQQLLSFLQEHLHLSLDLTVGKDDPPVAQERHPSGKPLTISAEVARRFYEMVLRESGYEGWRVITDTTGSGVTRVESGLRQVLLAEETFTLERVGILLAHELAGHVARSFAGEHSPIGLLGIGTRGYELTEEGLALYHERHVEMLRGYAFDDSGLINGMLATGLVAGIITPPQTFWSLYTFFERLIFLYRRLLRPWREKQSDQKIARKFALMICLRTFRGVPDLEQMGVCYLQDVAYLRGLLLVDRVISEDATVLDQLAVGKVAYDLLPVLQPLQIASPPQPLRELAYHPELDSYILSFEANEEKNIQVSNKYA